MSSSEFEFLTDLREEDAKEKKAKAEKAKLRTRFFDKATEQERQGSLGERYAVVPAQDEKQARERIARYYSGFTISAIRETDGDWEAILVEDPALVPFSIEVDGYIFERQIRSGSVMLDDERLKEEDPELYESITRQVTVVKPLDDLDKETLAKLASYIYTGQPSVALPAPKEAKPEDE